MKEGMPPESGFREIAPRIAKTTEELEKLKREGVDPIIYRENEHEVFVYTKRGEVTQNIHAGSNWHMSEGADERPDNYEVYTFTRLSEDELMEHLADPTKHRGSD